MDSHRAQTTCLHVIGFDPHDVLDEMLKTPKV